MFTNTLTNKTKHEYRAAKSHSAWNHAVKIHRLQLQRWICSSSHYEGMWNGCRLQLHSRLPSKLYWVKLSNSYPGRFTPRENGRWKYWIRNWVDPRTGVDAFAEEKHNSLLLAIDLRLFWCGSGWMNFYKISFYNLQRLMENFSYWNKCLQLSTAT